MVSHLIVFSLEGSKMHRIIFLFLGKKYFMSAIAVSKIALLIIKGKVLTASSPIPFFPGNLSRKGVTNEG